MNLSYVLSGTAFTLLVLASPLANASVDARITASRTSCVSPCPVMVTAEGTESSETDAPWHELGYHFDFGDPDSGEWDTTGLSKARQVGGPMAMHTFECSAGQCVFVIGMRAQDASGAFDDAFVEVVVDAPDHRYAATDTVCVSPSSTFFEGGDDVPCPEGAVTSTQVPNLGDFTGRRILLRRGESFDRVCIGFGESEVLIEPYGREGDARPEVAGVEVGRAGECGDHLPTTEQALSYGERWASDLTVTGLRTPDVALGMSYSNVSVVGNDLDYRDEPRGGEIHLSESGRICTTQGDLDCSAVPYPYGVYVVENTVIGSSAAPPAFNISAFNCPMLNWVGLAGNVVEQATGHNYRSQGHWRGVWMHNEVRGTHLTTGKQKLTIRGTGTLDYEPVGFRGDNPDCTSAETGNKSRYGVVADNILGSETSSRGDGFKSGAHPQNVGSVEGLEDIIFERNTFIEVPGELTTDINLAGRNLTCRADNVWSSPDNTNRNCKTGDHLQLPPEFQGPYREAQVPPTAPDAPGRDGTETSTGANEDSDGGGLSCSCRQTGTGGGGGSAALLAVMLGLLRRRR
ncbi:MAG: hypothetical protein ACRBN8_05525 [Nannocystales bacterium]